MSNIEKYEEYLKSFEHNEFSQDTIINKFIKVLANSRNFDEYVEKMHEINDVVNWYGYSFQFVVPELNKTEYTNKEYVSKITNITKSKLKTKELIEYLSEVRDYRLTISALSRLKIKFLIELNIIPKDNDTINQNLNNNFYDLYFSNYENIELRSLLDNSFKFLGLDWIEINYIRFRMDMEYVLYSINFYEKYETYLKINTIKVGLNICPSNYFIWEDKVYYNEKIAKYINKYLKLIDKKIAEKYKIKYQDIIDDLDDTGYKLLYNML